jgi:hypothetical protein
LNAFRGGNIKQKTEKKEAGKNGTRELSRRGFLSVGVLAAGAALTRCGDTIYNYHCPDAGRKPDSRSDTHGQKADSGSADACVPDNQPLTCNDFLESANVLMEGDTIVFGNMALRFDGTSYDGKQAIVSMLDSCGDVLLKDKIAEGQLKQIYVNGKKLEVIVNGLAPWNTTGAKWADITVRDPECGVSYWCESIYGILKQGESIGLNNMLIRFDDPMVVGQDVYALFTVLDSDSNVIKYLKIKEQDSEILPFGGNTSRLTAKSIGAGMTFNSKYVELSVETQVSKPCGS